MFCCRGIKFRMLLPGLSPDLQSMEQIRRIMRPTDVPDQGLLCDLLWSDPDKETMGWGENDRGVSFTFGAEVVAKFLHKHDLDLICRAHQVMHTVLIFHLPGKLVCLVASFILIICCSLTSQTGQYSSYSPSYNHWFVALVDIHLQSIICYSIVLNYKISDKGIIIIRTYGWSYGQMDQPIFSTFEIWLFFCFFLTFTVV